MHPAIGKLNNGKYYAYLNGYDSEPFYGTLEEVEIALGVREPVAPAPAAPAVEPAQKAKTYDVTMTFQYPAWDEGDGIRYPDIVADSKSEANRIARRQADQDGHLAGGKGRVTFTAVEQ